MACTFRADSVMYLQYLLLSATRDLVVNKQHARVQSGRPLACRLSCHGATVFVVVGPQPNNLDRNTRKRIRGLSSPSSTMITSTARILSSTSCGPLGASARFVSLCFRERQRRSYGNEWATLCRRTCTAVLEDLLPQRESDVLPQPMPTT